MLRLGCAVLLVSTSVVAASPYGKVVRVERSRKQEVTPIVCMLRPAERFCFGPAPKIGEVVTVVDEKTITAQYRIDSVKSASKSCDVMWTVEGELLSGKLDPSHDAMGLIDPSLDARRLRQVRKDDLRSPSSDAEAKPVFGFDATGDSMPEFMVTQSKCPGSVSGVPGQCFDFWAKRDQKMKSVFSADLQACFL
jgi:hypothetical protein